MPSSSINSSQSILEDNNNINNNSFQTNIQSLSNQQQQQLIIKKYSFIQPFIFSFLFIFASIIWCSLQIIQIQQQKELNITINLKKEEENNKM
uniref:Transmembrane protein n=1 Tax=Meloidogyne hapla TaxID=6305 RepID=A0A1I8B4C3_MELHA